MGLKLHKETAPEKIPELYEKIDPFLSTSFLGLASSYYGVVIPWLAVSYTVRQLAVSHVVEGAAQFIHV